MSNDDIKVRAAGFGEGEIAQAVRNVSTVPSSSEKVGEGHAWASVPAFKGNVTVDVTVDTATGEVEKVVITGDEERIGRSAAAVNKLEAAMNEARSIKVDTVSSATVTSQAILDAADYAYKLATDALPAEKATMKPGLYEVEQYGFYPGLPIKIGVTVSEDKIESVDIDDDNLEIELMLRAVRDRFVPRVIRDQALSVDAISSATVTSNAVRLGIERAVKEAFAANGAGPEAVFDMLKPQAPDAEADLLPLYETDVLVVGMGGSGIVSALSAAENGAKVLAIDKAGRWGGTTCVSSESCAVNAPRYKKEYNDDKDYVDADEFKAHWSKLTQGDHKPELLDMYFEESGKTIDWLHFDHGFIYDPPHGGHADYATYDVCYTYHPYSLADNKHDLAVAFQRLLDKYAECGGKYILELEATEMIIEDGAVVGVKARRYDGQTTEIRAKATIIGTGGFGLNKELMKEYMIDDYFPLSGEWHAYGMLTNDGKMIAAARDQAGAAMKNPSVAPLSHLAGFPVDLLGFGNHTKDEDSFFTARQAIWSQGDLPHTLCVAADSLAVTRAGNRFINEEKFAVHGAIVGGPEYFTIWSQEQFEAYKKDGLDYADPGPSMGYCGCRSTIPLGMPLDQLDDVMDAAVATGYAHKADTIAELAEQIGIDPAVLEETVAAYNAACEAGEDAEFGKDPKYLKKIGEGPYYAVLGCAFFYTTAGGLDINTDIQVLHPDGTPVEGLYAVGTDSMGVLMTEKDQYLDYGGCASGWALTSGRLAGAAAAKKALGK